MIDRLPYIFSIHRISGEDIAPVKSKWNRRRLAIKQDGCAAPGNLDGRVIPSAAIKTKFEIRRRDYVLDRIGPE